MHTATVVLPWLLSAITIWMNVAAGNRRPGAWAIGLVGQLGWLVWIYLTANWGFLPMNFALWIVYGRNHLKWQREKAIVPRPTLPPGSNVAAALEELRLARKQAANKTYKAW